MFDITMVWVVSVLLCTIQHFGGTKLIDNWLENGKLSHICQESCTPLIFSLLLFILNK